MKARFLKLSLVFVLLATCGGATTTLALDIPPVPAVPGAVSLPGAVNRSALAPHAAGPLIVDHTAVQQFDQIPDYWLNEARKLVIHYGHTSHGSQILSGLLFLQRVNGAKYTMNIRYEGNAQVSATVPLTPSARIPVGVAAGGESTLRITNEGAWPIGYWWTSDGLSGTKQVLSYAGGLFDVSGWSWCSQVSYCDSYLNCANDQYIYDYLYAMEDLEQSFPNMTFFYMTGHVVGPHEATARRNGIIRDYCASHGKVLFDFADIESWDLDGNYHPETTGSCEWCETWCQDPAHADDLECQYQALLPLNSDIYYGGAGCYTVENCTKMCAHSHGINCVIKGKAFWWMLARIAGWDGTPASEPDLTPSYKAASRASARQGERITYTVAIRSQTGPLSVTALLTDTIPAGLAYVPGTLTATMGIPNDSGAPTLRWSGVLSPTPTITVTFAVTVTAPQATAIINAAVIAASGHAPITRTVAIMVNPRRTYLPLVLRNP